MDINSHINDMRTKEAFSGVTFSEFKQTDAKKALLQNMMKSRIEPSCYWSAEMICSGHYNDLWEIIILFYTKHIHLGNPKAAKYLNMRINDFRQIMNSGYNTNEIQLRNNVKIRKIFAEIICILCLSKRRQAYSTEKLTNEDFDMVYMTEKLKADNLEYIEKIYKTEDPKEIIIGVNELAYNLSGSVKNSMMSVYWIEWIILFNNRATKNKQKIECDRRTDMPIDGMYQKHVICLIWEVFIEESKRRSKVIKELVLSLRTIYSLRFTPSVIKKRIYVMYFIVSLLCENVKLTESVLTSKNMPLVTNTVYNIDNIYKQIKKNEHSSKTDYLFKDSKAYNFQNTMNKIDQINAIDIPRTL